MELSTLLTRFQEDYPIKEGYRVNSVLQDGLGVCSGRLASNSPSDDRLPIERFLISTHRLLDSDGRILRDGRAMGEVSTPKELEALEKASFANLLFKLGYKESIAAQTPAKAAKSPTVRTIPREDVQDRPPPLSVATGTPAPIPLSIQRRLASLAGQLGIETPACTSLPEANRALLRLNAQVNSELHGPADA